MTSEERIRQLESENAALKNRVAYLERQLYGQRTEKHLPVMKRGKVITVTVSPGSPRR